MGRGADSQPTTSLDRCAPPGRSAPRLPPFNQAGGPLGSRTTPRPLCPLRPVVLFPRQHEAGAQVVQIFDSWAANLSPMDFDVFAGPYLHYIIKEAKKVGVRMCVLGGVALGAQGALGKLRGP